MLIRLLFIQRNTINSNYFLAISKNRYRKLKFDILINYHLHVFLEIYQYAQ